MAQANQKSSKSRVVSKQPQKNFLSSKVVAIVFIIVFAVVGTVLYRMSHAEENVALDPVKSNQKAFADIKASFARHGIKLTPFTKLPAKPKDFGTVRKQGALEHNTSQLKGSDVEVPAFPKLPTNPQLPESQGSLLIPKVHADAWTRAYAVSYAQQFLGWQGQYFFYYGTFPNEEWCSDFASYIMNMSGHPFYWGLGGWRVQRVDNVILGMYYHGTLRARGYVPAPGDLVFFDWGDGGIADHIGIVESVDSKGNIHTIEGNTNNSNRNYSQVARKTWAGNSNMITGYGVWLGGTN